MAVAVLSTPASMTAEQYHRISEHLDASRTGPPPGRRFHACFGQGDHLMVFDVWDSIVELDAFTTTLMPILAAEHIDMARPEPLEIHDLVDGGDSRALRKTIAELREQGLLHPPDREASPQRQGEALSEPAPRAAGRRRVLPAIDGHIWPRSSRRTCGRSVDAERCLCSSQSVAGYSTATVPARIASWTMDDLTLPFTETSGRR